MVSQQYEANQTALDTTSATSNPTRFGPIVDLGKLVNEAIPSKTRQQTKWCTDTWDAWHSHHVAIAATPQEIPPKLVDMDKDQLDHWLKCAKCEDEAFEKIWCGCWQEKG